MPELNIKTHNFETAKERINEFAKAPKNDVEFKYLDEHRHFIEVFLNPTLGTKRIVKAEDFNAFLTQIEKELIDINKVQIKTIEEFSQIYKALVALDEDYIQHILGNLEETKKAVEAIKIPMDGLENLNQTLTKRIDKIQRDYEISKEKINRLQRIKHLRDVDELWKLTEGLSTKTTEIQNLIENLDSFFKKGSNNNAILIESMTKKIKYTYLAAGSALGLALIELLIIFFR